jgi:hypothetical protein
MKRSAPLIRYNLLIKAGPKTMTTTVKESVSPTITPPKRKKKRKEKSL